MKKILFITALWTFLLSSCIKDEAPNSEADILSFTLPDSVVYAQTSVLNSELILFINGDADITKVTPIIELTSGAKLASDSATFDLSKTKFFEVVSQDGRHSKKYKVNLVIEYPILQKNMNFDFEEWNDSEIGKYGYFPQLIDKQWQSGNLGIWATAMGNKNNVYPTKDTIDHVKGERGLRLRTLKGKKAFGTFIPIFSGSLFYGVFTLVQTDPPKGVLFGQPFSESYGDLKVFTGYYKYKAGDVFTDKDGNEVPGMIDECTIRAFLYKVRKGATTGSKGEDYLTGRDDILTSSQVVAIADLKDTSAKSEFTKFSIPFEYKEVVDFNSYDYRLGIVFASSKKGDFYEGAVGSTLVIDDVEIVCEIDRNKDKK